MNIDKRIEDVSLRKSTEDLPNGYGYNIPVVTIEAEVLKQLIKEVLEYVKPNPEPRTESRAWNDSTIQFSIQLKSGWDEYNDELEAKIKELGL